MDGCWAKKILLFMGSLCLLAVTQTGMRGNETATAGTHADTVTGGSIAMMGTESDSGDDWAKPLSRIDLTATPQAGRLPPDFARGLFSHAGRAAASGRPDGDWESGFFFWAPSDLEHQPLYFDDVPLERYGQTTCVQLQPFLSAARFFGTFPIMPFKIGVDHPYELVSTLGYYRPGSCAPCTHQTLPFEWDAAALEGGAWVGFIFLLP